MSIEINNLSYTYSPNTPYEQTALEDISFKIEDGDFVGIVGSTGSGKSTLIQHLNGLIRLTAGEIIVNGMVLSDKKVDLKKLRRTVGMLFQYPEYQLFEDTVLKDVAFGPMNFGFSKVEAYAEAEKAIRLVGLDFDEVKDKSPFELSGGQKRRAAIAGVIAYKPEILVLDEPTAGLDPIGKRDILELIKQLHKESIKTIIMISHNMDEIAEYTKHILVLHKAKLVYDTTPQELFKDKAALKGLDLDIPHVVNIQLMLRDRGIELDKFCLNAEDLGHELLSKLGGKNV